MKVKVNVGHLPQSVMKKRHHFAVEGTKRNKSKVKAKKLH